MLILRDYMTSFHLLLVMFKKNMVKIFIKLEGFSRHVLLLNSDFFCEVVHVKSLKVS